MAILLREIDRDEGDTLLKASFQLRQRILVETLGWELPCGGDDLEIDQFDAGRTVHLVSLGRSGNVRGTLRLTPSQDPNLTCDVLQEHIQARMPRGPHLVECSRLCVDLALPARERLAARSDLFLSHLEVCVMFGWTQTLGLMKQSALQEFIRAGLAVDILAPPVCFGDDLEWSVAFLVESGPEALQAARRTYGMQSSLRMFEPPRRRVRAGRHDALHAI